MIFIDIQNDFILYLAEFVKFECLSNTGPVNQWSLNPGNIAYVKGISTFIINW